GIANLVRKEVRLQMPIFLIGILTTGCWMITLAALVLQPARASFFTNVFDTIGAIHIILVFVLAASVSLGEEKSLGLAAWHLTLPVSAMRQWLVKVSVVAATVALVGFVVPLILAGMTPIHTAI